MLNQVELPQLLIVDDATENLQLLSSLLQGRYRIKVAKSGEKALEILQQDVLPDLILLDILMPGIDGYTVCRHVKAEARTSKIPVIFLTALNEVNDETRGFKVGGADFITKPFNPDIVLARIQTQIELQAERKKSESLLRILLPEQVINDLIQTGQHTPEVHPEVSILFCDFVGFTQVTTTLSPVALIEELSAIFSEFDEICEANSVTRIKTIGDAYMAVCGLNGTVQNHADKLVETALAFVSFLEKRNQMQELEWNCRIGIHSGSVIGGIVGKTRFVYDVMGDDVNIAARVESNGMPMQVVITSETKSRLKSGFTAQSIGSFVLKGKGEKELFVVN
jgi:class 3 adenylate cyclase